MVVFWPRSVKPWVYQQHTYIWLYWRTPIRWLFRFVVICSVIHRHAQYDLPDWFCALCICVAQCAFCFDARPFCHSMPLYCGTTADSFTPLPVCKPCVDPLSTGNLCNRFRSALGTFVLYRNPCPVEFACYWLCVNFHKCLLKHIRACDVHMRNFLFSVVLSLLHFPSKRL